MRATSAYSRSAPGWWYWIEIRNGVLSVKDKGSASSRVHVFYLGILSGLFPILFYHFPYLMHLTTSEHSLKVFNLLITPLFLIFDIVLELTIYVLCWSSFRPGQLVLSSFVLVLFLSSLVPSIIPLYLDLSSLSLSTGFVRWVPLMILLRLYIYIYRELFLCRTAS